MDILFLFYLFERYQYLNMYNTEKLISRNNLSYCTTKLEMGFFLSWKVPPTFEIAQKEHLI